MARAIKFNPHQYQEDTLQFMDEVPTAAILLDPGMGKTVICLEDFRRREEDMLINRALVIAPLKVCYSTWGHELKKWKGFGKYRMNVAHGKGRRIELINASQINVINPAGLEWLEDNIKNIDAFDVIYIDESTQFKNGNSQRSKRMVRICQKMRKKVIPYRYILTGTPTPKSIEDLYGQFRILDPKILGNTLTEFRTRFGFKCSKRPWATVWEPGADSFDLITEAIAPYSMRLDASDHLNMPDIVQVHRMIELPPEVRSIYKELEKEMFFKVGEGLVVAANAGVLSSKCRQVANGAVYLSDVGEPVGEESSKIEYLHTEKVKELGRLFDELGQKPLLVTYEYKHDLSAILKFMKNKYGFKPPYIGETTNEIASAKLIDAWNEGKLPMLLANPASASWGLNLQTGGHHICWYSMTWNLEHYIQMNGRLWRQGQPEGVFVHHIMAEDTIDQVVWETYLEKDAGQIKLLKRLKRSI